MSTSSKTFEDGSLVFASEKKARLFFFFSWQNRHHVSNPRMPSVALEALFIYFKTLLSLSVLKKDRLLHFTIVKN